MRGAKSDKVTFPNARGESLAGRIDYPPGGEPLAFAVFAQCFTCSKDLRFIGQITRTLAFHGIATLRFDFAGLGESEGEFADTTFSSNVSDLIHAAKFLGAPEIVIGHSLGGAVALAAVSDLDSVKAVVTVGAPATPEHVRRHLLGEIDEIESKGEATIEVAGRPFTFRKEYLDDLGKANLGEKIEALGRPLLVLHSPVDNTVGVENAAEIFSRARHPKSFVSLDTADHLISNEQDSRYVAELIASWSTRYVERDLRTHWQPDWKSDSPESVTVLRTEDGFRTEIISNGFPLIADEPVEVGGANSGPTPYDYLLTSLGACTAMTIRMYSDKKKWGLERVEVRLSHRKIHARDCEKCEATGGYLDHIEREIDVKGDLDNKQRQRLLEIAERCPVHKTLEGEVIVHSTLAG